MSKYTEPAKQLLEKVGGSENIDVVTHCATRMRFVLNDPKEADVEAIEDIDLVMKLRPFIMNFQKLQV